MISKDNALKKLLTLAVPMTEEWVDLTDCYGRVLALNLTAKCTHPPSDVSAMDGYAINDFEKIGGNKLRVIGESSAGKPYEDKIKAGEAVRIFTGGILPQGSNCVIIQEETVFTQSEIIINESYSKQNFVRKKGSDFSQGDLVKAPIYLTPSNISLLAAMNHAEIPVFCKPRVAIVATGNELVVPGSALSFNKVVSSNSYGLAAMLESFGAIPTVYPIAKDKLKDIQDKLIDASKNDLILTIGGVSVGNYDYVKDAALALGLKIKFHKVAMRPGKPLLAGDLHERPFIGLPGNPVSALICCKVMIQPLLNKMLGICEKNSNIKLRAKLTKPLLQNGVREHYMRAILKQGKDELSICPLERQDSSLLSELSKANALIVRYPWDPASKEDEYVDVLPFTQNIIDR